MDLLQEHGELLAFCCGKPVCGFLCGECQECGRTIFKGSSGSVVDEESTEKLQALYERSICE